MLNLKLHYSSYILEVSRYQCENFDFLFGKAECHCSVFVMKWLLIIEATDERIRRRSFVVCRSEAFIGILCSVIVAEARSSPAVSGAGERHAKGVSRCACMYLRSRTVNYREDRVPCGQCDHCQSHRNAAVSELTLSDPQLSPTSSTLYLLPTHLIVSPCRLCTPSTILLTFLV